MHNYSDSICLYYILLFSASKTRLGANNKLGKKAKEMILIIIDTTNRRIKRILKKLRQNKSQLTAFVAWVSLSALCLTILVVANHAVETIASRLKDSAVEAIATETEKGDDTAETQAEGAVKRQADESTAPETGADQSTRSREFRRGICPRPRRRSKPDLATETARDALLLEAAVVYEKYDEILYAQCSTETKSAESDDDTRKPDESSATNAPSDTTAPETTENSDLPVKSDYSTKAHHWYCKNNDNHARPPLPAEFQFIIRHDGYWIGKEGCGKVIYLTFDAGYENGNIAKILDILKSKKVPAAFFILENLARREPQLVKRMADDGHLVCNHTATHKDMTKLSESEFTDELARLEKAVREHAGVEIAKFYRPPSGTFSERDLALAKKLGYKTIMWSYAYADWDNNAQPKPDRALEKLLGHTHEGMVLLLHPTSSTNAEILNDFIDRLISDGWRFATLTELTSS